MSYYVAIFFSKFFCLLPAAFCDWIGTILGHLTWYVVPKKRRNMAIDNVRRCLKVDEREASRIAKLSWVRFGPMLFEVLRFPVMKQHFSELVEIEGTEYLKEGLKLGRGGVIAGAHCGNWELMGGALSAAGFPIVGVAKKQKEAGADKFINEFRRLVGMHITYKDNIREMFQMMKKGWYIGLLMDQDPFIRDGIIIDWFGRPTNCVQGPAVLARYKDAPLYPGYIHRNPDGTHKITIYPRIEVPHTDNKEADIRQAIEAVNAVLEQHIRKYPEEWFWLHNRWKSIDEYNEQHDIDQQIK